MVHVLIFALMALLFTQQDKAPAKPAILAPTGTLRAVFLGDNPVQGRVDSKTGEITGPVADLVKELARKLGVPYKIIPAPDARGVMDAMKNHTADIGFLAYDETRAREVDYGAPFAIMFNSYLVGAKSPIKNTSDVDRAGVKVGAVKGQSQELFVSSHLKNAQVRVFPTVPPQAELESLLSSGEVDAFAINRQRSLDAEAASHSRLRALPDSFLDVDQSFVVEKGAVAKIEAIEKFAAEVRTSGFIKASIERAKLKGAGVPPEAPIVQPGAPGESSRIIARDQAVDLSHVGYTKADVQFMQGMIHHHAQALDMTGLLSTRTNRQDMRLLAKRIEISQADEIKMMQHWIEVRGEEVPGEHEHHMPGAALMPGMLTPEEMERLAKAKGAEFDRLFLEFMIRHHAGAIIMVDELFSSAGAGQESEVFAFASDVVADQRAEIDRMGAMLKELEK